MKLYLIKVCWVAGNFYLKCQIGGHIDGHLDAKSCQDKYPDAIRYCPPKEGTSEQITCQPEGYTMFVNGGNHEVPLLGASKLQQWGFDSNKILNDTFHYYLKNGNVVSPEPDIVGGSTNETMLPVCLSRHAVIWDHEHNEPKKNGNFPCSCGPDWWGSETRRFLDRLKIGQYSDAYSQGPRGRAWDILVNTCNGVSLHLLLRCKS